jgi:diguanylate cyclase (GGDEF)-like protein
MTESGDAARVLSAAQERHLLDVRDDLARSRLSREMLFALFTRIAGVLNARIAVIGKVDGECVVLADSLAASATPLPGGDLWLELGRSDDPAPSIHVWHDGQREWTILSLTTGARRPVALVIEGDWTASTPTLFQLAQNLRLAGRAFALSSRVDVARVVHRLTRALGRAEGVNDICAATLRHIVRAVPSRLAAFAVPTDENRLAIVATHGYPIELVQGIRIVPGNGIIGGVYQRRTPLRVPDVTAFDGLQRSRPRYRTKSFMALPVLAGTRVLGVVCVTDRLDEGPFTQADMSVLRAFVAPAALALSREQAKGEAEAFARAAAIDPVSGLFNRRYFHSRLDEELQRARRHGTPIGLMMIDIDDFKSVNDRFGHVAGDMVIGGVADIIRRSVRRFDTCARYGGEEFAVVMPGGAGENAASVAERIRQRIDEYRAELPELADLRVTASIGLSVSHDGSGARELINRADRALYAAKHAGKNRVVGATSMPLIPPAGPERYLLSDLPVPSESLNTHDSVDGC